ncbi:MAG: DUF5106 domain-containing protein [Chitinophagales bacterium]|nr:DUF5106 domain-containing protein [Chitinophagales bacterium]
MRKILLAPLLLVAAIVCFALPAKAKDAYSIKVKITSLKDTSIYLAYHFGDKQYMKDTLKLNNMGMGTFRGTEKLEQGIYLVVMPSKTYFEIIVGDDQDFSIENDTANFVEHMKVEGSDENRIFYDDMRFIMGKQKERQALDAKLKEEKDEQKKKDIKKQLEDIDKSVVAYRKDIRIKNPNLLYSKVLYTLEEIEIPEAPKNEKGVVIDSAFTYKYYKQHYFDHIDLADPRMLKTPVLFNKVEYYLEKVMPQLVDSLNPAVDYIIDAASKNDTTYKFWVVTLLNKYANTKVMCLDGVYVHIGDKYYCSGKASWVDSADVVRICDRVKAMKPTMCDLKAPGLMLKDSSGNYHNLYSLPSKYVLLYFYDPDCGHCKKETPHVVAAMDSLMKKYDVKVYAVATEIEREKWINFLKEFKMDKFINVADIELQNNFRQIYDIQSTPRIFLLDKNRVIRAKRFSAEQIGLILEGIEKMDSQGKDRKLEDNIDATQRQKQ